MVFGGAVHGGRDDSATISDTEEMKITATLKMFLFAVIGTLLFNSTAYAEKWHTSTIDKVYVVSSGALILIFSTDSESCTNGNDPDYYRVETGYNGMTIEGLKHILSLALTAATTKTPVTFAFDETTDSCYINRLQVRYDMVN